MSTQLCFPHTRNEFVTGPVAGPWTTRNYTSSTGAAFATIAERRQIPSGDLELGAIGRDDMVASLAAYVKRTDASGGETQAIPVDHVIVLYGAEVVLHLVRGD